MPVLNIPSPQKKRMIKIDSLKEILKLIIYSGYIVGEKPISLMIVGKVGIGKSAVIEKFELIDNIAFLTDVTYMGIIGLLKDNKELRHIIIPDFLKLTMKKGSTADNLTSCLNCLMEEGLYKISLFGVQEDFKGKKVGLVTATTKKSYEKNYNKWKTMGFLSRMIKISFSYSDETMREIFNYIFERGYLKDNDKEKLEIPYKNFEIKLDKNLAKQLKDKKSTFRSQKIMQTLAMASALVNGRDKVTLDDIKEIKRLSRFMNLNYTKI